MGVVIEGLKQRIVAITTNGRRYQERIDMLSQDRMFQNNQRKFYNELNQEEERCYDNSPDAVESKKFLRDIWSELIDHNRDAKWVKHLQMETSVPKQEKLNITKRSLKKSLDRISNWKSQQIG